MSFGALFQGDSGQVIIDDSHPCMHAVFAGTYPATSGVTTVTFPAPINSPVPPFIFVRPNGAQYLWNVQFQGSAGNWTGFTIEQFTYKDMSGVSLGGAWKAAAVMLPRAGDWGMLVRDTAENILFDSNRPIVKFLGGVQQFDKYAYNGGYLSQWTVQTWRAALAFPSAYFMVSHFRQQQTFTANVSKAGIGFISADRSFVYVSTQEAGNGQPNVSTPFNWPLICIE